MSFRDWLMQFRQDENAIGDLARDATADRCFPRPIKGPDRLERYEDHLVEVHDAAPAAVETLRSAWDAYERRQAVRVAQKEARP